MKTGVTRSFLLLCLSGAVCAVPSQAQVCSVTNSSLTGTYGYAAIQTVWTTNMQAVWTSNMNGTAPYSSTGIGQLIGGIDAGQPFATTGLLSFDGAGNVSATSAPQGTSMAVGTYNVEANCAISIQLKDTFNTSTTPNTMPTKLEGVVLGRGSEIDLGPLMMASVPAGTGSTGGSGGSGGSGSGSSGSGSSDGSGGSGGGGASTAPSGTSDAGSSTSASATATTPSNLVLRLTKVLAPSGCNASTLSGSYGVVLTGTSGQAPPPSSGTPGTPAASPATPTGTPFSLIGRMQFDGAGNLIAAQPMPAGTGVSQFTGTYTVNPDCTGTMTLTMTPVSGSSASSTQTASSSMTATFVITTPTIAVNPGSPSNVGSYPQRPGLEISTSSSTLTASGLATAQ